MPWLGRGSSNHRLARPMTGYLAGSIVQVSLTIAARAPETSALSPPHLPAAEKPFQRLRAGSARRIQLTAQTTPWSYAFCVRYEKAIVTGNANANR